MSLKSPGRNDRCSCGSGKKYKLCCMRQDQQPKLTLEDMLSQIRQQYTEARYCLHPDAKACCGGQIVDAHSVQKSGGLSRIAEDSKVMDFNGLGATILKAGKIVPRLVGINVASVFTGFCERHDNETFKPLETQPFQGSDQQCFLLAYRAICHELYERQIMADSCLWVQERGKNVPLADRRASQQETDAIASWQVYRRNCTLFRKRTYDAALKANDYSLMNHYVVNLAGCPDLVCSGAICPRFDFAGNILQSANTNQVFDIMTCSVIPTQSGGAIVFGWVPNNPACQRFVQSLHALESVDLVQAVVRLLFYSIKTMYGSPKWWHGLDGATQSKLIRRREMGMGGGHSLNPSAYKDDGLKSVDWEVTSRETSMRL